MNRVINSELERTNSRASSALVASCKPKDTTDQPRAAYPDLSNATTASPRDLKAKAPLMILSTTWTGQFVELRVGDFRGRNGLTGLQLDSLTSILSCSALERVKLTSSASESGSRPSGHFLLDLIIFSSCSLSCGSRLFAALIQSPIRDEFCFICSGEGMPTELSCAEGEDGSVALVLVSIFASGVLGGLSSWSPRNRLEKRLKSLSFSFPLLLSPFLPIIPAGFTQKW